MTRFNVFTGEECMSLQIDSSRANTQKLVKIVDHYKRPVRITSVKVEQQITDVPCRLWKTFHYEDNIVRATGGCGALFNVCFEESLSSPKGMLLGRGNYFTHNLTYITGKEYEARNK